MLKQGGNAIDAAAAIGFRARRGPPGGRQPRRRRPDGHPVRRRPGDDDRLPRSGAGKGDARHVPGRAGAIPSPSAASSVRSRRVCPDRWPASATRSANTASSPLATVLAPAIRLAESGLRGQRGARAIARGADRSCSSRFPESLRVFTKNGAAVRRGRSAGAARSRAHAAARRETRTRRLLQGTGGRADRRRDGALGRAHSQERPRRATPRSSASRCAAPIAATRSSPCLRSARAASRSSKP